MSRYNGGGRKPKPGVVLLVWGVFCLSVGFQLAQAAAADAVPPGQPVFLQYKEAHQPIHYESLKFSSQGSPFAKEPDLGGRKAIRGTFLFGDDKTNSVPFIWDSGKSTLYLDLNRNRDLTDDSGGTFKAPDVGGYAYYQNFQGIRFKLYAPNGDRTLFFDLSLHDTGGRPNGTIAVRSYWAGQALFSGADVEVGFVESITSTRSTDASYLLIRPWSERDKSFSVGSVETVSFCPNLFFGKNAYQVSCDFVAQGSAPAFMLQFKEREAELGELKISGQDVKRLVLTGSQPGNSWRVVLDRPEPSARIPVATYKTCQARLAAKGVEADLDALRSGSYDPAVAKIDAAQSAMLYVGGPLTNTVSVQRQGRFLAFSYQLLGEGGRTYRLLGVGTDKPPGFVVVKNGKQIASGNFQYG